MKKIFKGVKALAFSSLMVCLCLILILITTYVSDIGLIILLLLPLVSSLVTLTCERKYVLIYFVASILVSLINFQIGLFEVIPSLIIGILLGIMIKKYIQGYYIIFINSIVLTILQIISTYLINAIYSVNLIDTFAVLLKLTDIHFEIIFFLFLFIISLIQISITYLIATNEFKKLDYQFNEKMNQFIILLIIEISSIILNIIIHFFYQPISYLLLGVTYYFATVLSYYIFSFYLKKRMLFIQLPAYASCLIIIPILISLIGKNYIDLILLAIPLSTLIGASYILFYQLIYKKHHITESIFDKID